MSRVEQIKAIRREILAELKQVYPTPFKAETIFRCLLAVFPDLEFDTLKKDLWYLLEKSYVVRVMPKEHDNPDMVPWRLRYFRLTATGVEIADRCRIDDALEP